MIKRIIKMALLATFVAAVLALSIFWLMHDIEREAAYREQMGWKYQEPPQ